MGIVKYIFESMEGIGIYPLVSMLVFLIFFAAVGVYVFTADKSYISKMKDLPLENTGENESND